MSQRVPEVCKLVTMPCHASDGKVVYRPGETFPPDHPLPEGVYWRWALRDPEPAA